MSYRDYDAGEWRTVSWSEFARKVETVSKALLAIGANVGENIGVFSQNKPETLYTSFGGFGARVTTVPMYATSSAAQVQYIVHDAGIRFIFVGEQEQYDTAFSILPACHSIEHIVIFDKAVVRNKLDRVSMSFDEFLALGEGDAHAPELAKRLGEACDTDYAHILYTSGTTGESKGVVFTYSMFAAAVRGHEGVLPISEDDVFMCFLPLSHIFELGWTYIGLSVGVHVAVNLRPQDVLQSLREVHPTCMSAVPRFWEKVYSGVMERIDSGSALRRRLMTDALAVSENYVVNYKSKGLRAPLGLRMKYAMFENTIIKLLKSTLGLERGNIFPTAGATISPVIEKFVHAAGIHMVKGYGLTESTATVSCDHMGMPFSIGSVGRLLPGVEVKISDEGEVLLKGATITPGYYKKEEATRQAFTDDGWFKTGDAGYMKDGELYLTDRIKDLFKTSNGKYIAPQFIESKLVVDRYIEQVVVVANERRFVSALIVPNYKLIEDYARSIGLLFGNRAMLCRDDRIIALFKERLETLQQEFASYERIKAFALLPDPLTIEGGELTNTIKVKRPFVYKKYEALINEMYEQAALQTPV